MGSKDSLPTGGRSAVPDDGDGIDRGARNGDVPAGRRGASAIMPRMFRVDVIAGVILVLVGAAAWIDAAPLPIGTLRYFGPGLMPMLLSIVLLAVGLLVFIAGILGKGGADAALRGSIRGSAMVGLAMVAFAVTIAGVNIGGVAIPPLGLVVAGPLAVMISGYASPEARFRELCALAFGFTAGCAALFNDVLGLTMPVLPDALQAALAGWMGWDMAARAAYVAYAVIAALILVVFPPGGAASDRSKGTEGE